MRTVQLIQINNNYGNQYYVPYSAGVLTTYAKQSGDIERQYAFKDIIFMREGPATIAERIGAVDILGVSSYIWNWQLSLAVAQEVRRRHPDTLIVFGGPQVPDHDPDFLSKNPVIDVAVHGEGESAFNEILLNYTAGKPLDTIPSVSYRDRSSGRISSQPKRPRMRQLSGLPSPYLNGEFESLFSGYPKYEWMAMWETNRGCPFSCTFCDWGSATASKVLEFDWDRLMAEIDWFSDHRINYLFCADANFGIRKRDINIAERLVKAKKERGYPRDFRVCFTKNSTQKIFDVAKIFHDAAMLKGISISMQSLSDDVLRSIKRDNIRLDVFRELQGRYTENNISTYSEIILGLPGETYQSYIDGIDRLIDSGQHSQIIINNCSIMPNAEMGDPTYQRKYHIETVEVPIFTAHATPAGEHDHIVEKEEVVVATSTMSRADWRRMQHYGWAVQLLHTMGLMQGIAIALHYCFDIRYRDLYVAVLEYAGRNPNSALGKELDRLNRLLDGVLAGTGFDQVLPEYAEITWPAEEASLLRISADFDPFYAQIKDFLLSFARQREIDLDDDLLDDLVSYQRATIVDPYRRADSILALKTNIPDCVAQWRQNHQASLLRMPHDYRIRQSVLFKGDLRTYAREIVWFGRKGGRYILPVEPLDAGEAAERSMPPSAQASHVKESTT
jgi:2-(S-pantetheinyl)-carbapenam-3-carboxylate methyltransferase